MCLTFFNWCLQGLPLIERQGKLNGRSVCDLADYASIESHQRWKVDSRSAFRLFRFQIGRTDRQ
jgi:hypothetical protein